MNISTDPWIGKVSTWAAGRPDIKALVQIGSRVQLGAPVDALSDYDFHLVTSDPGRYRNGAFAREISPVWAVSSERAFGGVTKVAAVYENALEADFVVIGSLGLRVAFAALGRPSTRILWPGRLKKGIDDLRIVAAPGWKMIKGGAEWQARYSRLLPLKDPMTMAEFQALFREFWTQLVWAAKKAERGEGIASQRAVHRHLVENLLRMAQEEALLAGNPARPFGRRAESWLKPAIAEAIAAGTRPDRKSLESAISLIATAFDGASAAVAAQNAWPAPDASNLKTWLGARRPPD
jgi:hypothetical protein